MSAKYTHSETQFAASRERAGQAVNSGAPSQEMLARWRERRRQLVREQIDAGIVSFADSTGLAALEYIERGA